MATRQTREPEPQPEPPAHLSERSQALWRTLVGTRVKSAGRMALLLTGLEALDRADQAAAAVAADGMTATSKSTGAVHAHPLLKTEKDSRALFLRVWQTLHLEWDSMIDGR